MLSLLRLWLIFGWASSQCSDFPVVGNPINVIAEQMTWLLKLFDPKNAATSPKILSLDEAISQGRKLNRGIYEVVSSISGLSTYIGLQTSYPIDGGSGSSFRVTKFLMTTEPRDLERIFGVKLPAQGTQLLCGDLKRSFFDHFFKKNPDLERKALENTRGNIFSSSLFLNSGVQSSLSSMAPGSGSGFSDTQNGLGPSQQPIFTLNRSSSFVTSAPSGLNFDAVINGLGLDLKTGRRLDGGPLSSSEFQAVSAKLLQLRNTKLSSSQISLIEGLIQRIIQNETLKISPQIANTQPSVEDETDQTSIAYQGGKFTSTSELRALNLPTFISFPNKRRLQGKN